MKGLFFLAAAVLLFAVAPHTSELPLPSGLYYCGLYLNLAINTESEN
jgi:hypothetical protein